MSSVRDEARPLGSILEEMDRTANHAGKVSLGELIDAAGHRSFGAILFVVGLLLVSPLSGVLVFPSVLALGVFLVSSQLLLGRNSPWLPAWLLRTSIEHERVRSAIGWLRKPVAFLDRISRPRLHALASHTARRLAALLCVLLSLAMPPLDLVPTANSLSGVILTTISLSLVVGDGLFLLLALCASVLLASLLISAFA